MEYEVVLTNRAKRHLRNIKDYIADVLSDPQASKNVLGDLEQAILSLENWPKRVPLAYEDALRRHGVHSMVVRRYLIYFQVDETLRQVLILAVIYGGRSEAARLAASFDDAD